MWQNMQIWLVTLAKPTLNVDLPNKGIAEEDILTNLLNTVYLIAGVAAVIAIIMGGFWYVTSNGEADKIKRGKNAIIYASIGLIVILFAFGITGFVSDRIAA